ncbi:MAG: glycosyl hydrolase-related protein, partial [Chloroflexota bacterium]|nr:glycosyl hydrolase-related protein [Chloroflexota bacterium]
MAAAYALNDPLLVRSVRRGTSAQVSAKPFISTESPNVVIETIKGAEDGRGVIVRLYESQRRRGKVTLDAGFPLREVWRTNL